MKIAILGAGFTGLTAGLRLLQQGHQVTIFEKEDSVGGLAGGFKKDSWDWTLEKSYHHWFTNDSFALNLAKELNHRVIIKRPKTNVFVEGKIIPLDSAFSLLTFPYLPLATRLRTGLITLYLKLSNNYQSFEQVKALKWLRKYMGQISTSLIWEPLFKGKFGQYQEDISLTWFWARIKKRTSSLAYPEGGFLSFAEHLAAAIKERGGTINLSTPITLLSLSKAEGLISSQKSHIFLTTNNEHRTPNYFDKVICTLPSPIFVSITPELPKDYVKKITSIPHLYAQNLILTLKEPFMRGTYWLNITDTRFPFLVLAEHTNFMDSKDYGNQHILYIGNYLPAGHSYLKLSAQELLKIFDPFLKQINPNYTLNAVRCTLFTSPFAQPVVTTNYFDHIPTMETPLKNVYLANMDMVYPWDRGTNYAIGMGEKIALFAGGS